MKLRTKYILFVAILHLLTLGLTFFIFNEKRVFFIASEVLIIISLVIAISLYAQLIRPIKLLLQGIEALKDRDFNVKFLPTGKHEVDQLINVYNQMIDQLRTERTQQEEQHFFLEKLIYTSPTGIIILDHDELVQQINPKALQILGMDEKTLIGNNIKELQHPLFEQANVLKAGETITVKLSGITIYKLQKSHFIDRGFQRDFLMIEELTAEILAAEKNTYGKVIRMMAHEVNNTVGPVNSIIQSTLKNDELWHNQVDNQLNNALQVAFDRNQNLNHFMRNFADLVKLPEANKKQTDLSQLINSVIHLMQIKAQDNNISLIYQSPTQPFYIRADVQQMEQALINIVKNAIESIGNNGIVEFKINTKSRQLIIVDDGKGINPDQSLQLFTPFYSTKKDGQGIGLTLVREIMLNHGYDFSLKTIDKQTAFTIGF
jgi:nitrogen fixation/metabolism regulation signal transduction histidine kinase